MVFRLAVAAGYIVATTAGPQNHDFVKSLGATYAFDHSSPTVLQDLLAVLQPGDVVFDCIGEALTQKACAEIAHKVGSSKFACVLPPVPNECGIESVFGMHHSSFPLLPSADIMM